MDRVGMQLDSVYKRPIVLGNYGTGRELGPDSERDDLALNCEDYNEKE